jgi:tetratricopeptide (TPR) repeat protein
VAYFQLLMTPAGGWGNFEMMRRVEQLLARARAIAPDSELILNTTVWWLRSVGRCREVIEAAQRAIQLDPNRIRWMTGVYNELGQCKTWTGHAEEEIALQAKVNQLNPRSPWMYRRYDRMGFASLMLGRDHDTIAYLQRSLAMDADDDVARQATWRWLAAAYARTGQMEEAKHSLASADRIWPYDTVRGHWPDDSKSAIYVEQIKGYQAALRLAGERDHADEDADFGVPEDRALHSEVAGPTSTSAPGVKTIRTAELARLLAGAQPVIIDTVTYSWGRSIPGAAGLKFAGLGGTFTDAAQERLRGKMRELTDGDLNRPVVAVGWNSERFDGRNLALRLAALGYTQIYWYRGGREAWEVNGLPETDLRMEDW